MISFGINIFSFLPYIYTQGWLTVSGCFFATSIQNVTNDFEKSHVSTPIPF